MVSILGLGTALPQYYRSTDRYIEHAKQFSCSNPRQERILEELYRRTAIAQRGSVVTEEAFPAGDCGPTTGRRMEYYRDEVGTLAKHACERAFSDANVSPDAITHLVTVSCTGFYAPGFDIELIQGMNLSPSTQRTHVGFMGCHGGLNGLRVARSYAQQHPDNCVLLCMAEACSLHFQYGWGTDRLVANSLFADGSAAAILRDGRRALQSGAHTDGAPTDVVVDSASYIIPDTLDAMMWRIGDHGFEMHLSAHVPAIIEELLKPWLIQWLSKNGMSLGDVASWAVHPGGPKILDAVENCLNLPASAIAPSREILAACGNMSSPTVFFILEKLRTLGTEGPCVMLGFGPGLTIEAALVQRGP